jgi:hypothetical protein
VSPTVPPFTWVLRTIHHLLRLTRHAHSPKPSRGHDNAAKAFASLVSTFKLCLSNTSYYCTPWVLLTHASPNGSVGLTLVSTFADLNLEIKTQIQLELLLRRRSRSTARRQQKKTSVSRASADYLTNTTIVWHRCAA